MLTTYISEPDLRVIFDSVHHEIVEQELIIILQLVSFATGAALPIHKDRNPLKAYSSAKGDGLERNPEAAFYVCC